MKRATIEEKVKIVNVLRHKYKLSTLLEISKLSKSTYFFTLNKVNLDDKNKEIINEIIDIYYFNKSRYGYRRITQELKNRCFIVNYKKLNVLYHH